MLKKFANATITISAQRIISAEDALSSEAITERFRTLTAEIKKIAPKSQDFLYFVARGIHAMEHSAIDPVSRKFDDKLGHIAHDNGSGFCTCCNKELLKNISGASVSGLWCQGSQCEPYVNQNGDAFAECELLKEVKDLQDPSKTIKAFQTFIGKGLFTDHKSSQVENIRGIILDAEYDYSTKGVDLLIALDKIAYPELARQITAGYSASLSMGTRVSHSFCSECGNKAITEDDYCSHVRTGKGLARAGAKKIYEVNNGLDFIEISMVSNGADPKAKIKTIIASLNKLRTANSENSDDQLILNSISKLEQELQSLESQINQTDNTMSQTETIILAKLDSLEKQINSFSQKISIGGSAMTTKETTKKAYFQGTVEPDGKVFDMGDKDYHKYWEDDKHMQNITNTGDEGLFPGDEEIKKMLLRASTPAERQKVRELILKQTKTAYFQGTVEPDGKVFDMGDKDYHKYWEDDKHMQNITNTGDEGLFPGDEQIKKDLLRAKLRAKLTKSANVANHKWEVFAGDDMILSVTTEQAYGEDVNKPTEDLEVEGVVTNAEWFASKPYGINLIKAIKQLGLTRVAAQIEGAKTIKTAQAMPPPALPVEPSMVEPAADTSMTDELPEEEMKLEPTEAIKMAADQIEQAVSQIVSVVDDIEGEHGSEVGEQGGEIAESLADVGTELGDLSQQVGEIPQMPPAQAAAFTGLVKIALNHAGNLLEQADKYMETYAKKKLNPGLAKFLKMKKTKKTDKKTDKKDEKKEKKALTSDEMTLRKQARQKLASELYDLTDGDMIDEAHPHGGNTSCVNHPQGKVETVKEQQVIDKEVAEAKPTGEVATARAEARAKVIEAAKQKVAQTPPVAPVTPPVAPVAPGKKVVDPKAVAKEVEKAVEKSAAVDKETKQYYAEESKGSSGHPDAETKKFYNELTQDFSSKQSKKAEFNVNAYNLKMKRCMQLAIKQANLGQISTDPDSITNQTERLMGLDDTTLTHLIDVVDNTKRVAHTTQIRTAGAVRVGTEEKLQDDIKTELERMWSRR